MSQRNIMVFRNKTTLAYRLVRTNFTTATFLKIAVALFMSLPALACQNALAQEALVQDDPTAIPVQTKSYAELVTEIQGHEDKINRLFSSMPIGFPAKQQVYLDEIARLKKLNVVLSKQLDKAAYNAYQEDPQLNVKAGQLVFRQITRKLDPPNSSEKFDPRGALEIASMMIKVGLDNGTTPNAVQFKDVAYQAFRASYAIQEFDRAQLMLDKIAEQGVELRPTIAAKLNNTAEKWKTELMIRRQESSNDDLPIVKFETTEGSFTVELFENHAPKTVGNFINLVEKSFYNDKPFFLVQPGKFAQSGCPLGDGSGDAGYRIPCECDREKIRHHFTGTVSMTHAGKDTGSSQFFITHQPNPQWDGRYTAFGRVTEGMDVIYGLRMIDSTRPNTKDITPSKITKVTVIRKRDHEYVPSPIAEFGRIEDDAVRTAQDDGQ